MTDKIFVDNQGKVLKVGDPIMYVTDGPRINYGTIQKIAWVIPRWSTHEQLRIHVWKVKGGCMEKERTVILTYPTIFKCGEVLQSPDSPHYKGR